MIKWVSILALSVAVIVGAVSGVVVFNKREAVARAAQGKAEAEESAAKEATRKAQVEERTEKIKAAAAEDSAKAAEQNRIAKEAELEAGKAAAAAAADQRKAAEARRDAAEAEADKADADRAAAKAKMEASRHEAERARSVAEAERSREEAAKAALAREKAIADRVTAEARLGELKLMDLQRAESELLAFKRELDEREKALKPERTVKDLVGGMGEDVVFDENGVARKQVVKPPYLAENDMTLPRGTRELARVKRRVDELRAEREKADRDAVVAKLERLRARALERDDIPSAETYASILKSFYPDWQPGREKNDEPKSKAPEE